TTPSSRISPLSACSTAKMRGHLERAASMNLEILVCLSRDLHEVFRTNKQIAQKFNPFFVVAPFIVESDSDEWDIICAASNSEDLCFNVQKIILIPHLMEKSLWHAPQIRKTCPLSDSEFNLWSKSIDKVPLVSVGEGKVIRRYESFTIRKTPKKACDFFGPDSGPNIFICDRQMREHLEAANIVGLEYGQLFRKGHELHSDHFVLYSKVQLPLSPYHLCDKRLFENGVVTLCSNIAWVYEPDVLRNLSVDAAMTAESEINESSQLLVSSKFVETVDKFKIKGLEFYPVFECGTLLYNDLVSSIERIRRMTAQNPFNRYLNNENWSHPLASRCQ
ncbi:MAG: hypothetical protein ACU837_17205, partial [Gammaproteobacteria bacterium]